MSGVASEASFPRYVLYLTAADSVKRMFRPGAGQLQI